MSLVIFSRGEARAQEQIKPFVLVVFDTSGSMDGSTGDGPPSCGGTDQRINHAKCALQQVVDAHADISFAMGRFRADSTTGCANCRETVGFDCSACDTSNGNGCTATMKSPDRLQLLVPFVDDSNDAIRSWTDFSCGGASCSLDPASNPEIIIPGGNSFTPLGGSLRGARRFFQGLDTNITSNSGDNLDAIYGAGIDDPIGNDPLNTTFITTPPPDNIVRQCRPYVVILLTDGAETCERFDIGGGVTDDTVGAALDLLNTPYAGTGLTYRIETKPIGFGLTEPNTQIEALAQAGGAANGPGSEGFYANSELELVSAFNQIIADSILVEICDGEDNDCDGNVDEGFQLFCDVQGGNPTANLCVDPGDFCNGFDDNCADGVADEVLNACGQCGAVPVETCNFSDDDCDGFVDETPGGGVNGALCNGCVPVGAEICNNADEDCDGFIDEDVADQACGTDVGICSAGTEECISGSFQNCTATGGSGEICNGLDDDCNGVIDGFVQECFTLPGNNDTLAGPCQPGFQICEALATPAAGNSFGACLGEIGPVNESCDLINNDCDANIDEDTGGADCGSACGTGTTQCNAGVLECSVSGNSGTDEECNNLDDDCDGVIDENVPDPVPNTCDEGGTLCIPGVLQCLGGSFVCTGGEAPGIEVCDCQDNDCDNNVDEEPPALCPTGSTCTDCQCAFPCQSGEFPCPVGFLCSSDNFCLVDPCANVDCGVDGNGNATTCVDGACVISCTLANCPTGTACRPSDGSCQFDDCRGFPEICAADEFCVIDECVSDPCTGVDCPADGQYCFEGACVGTCAGVNCPETQGCVLGECQPLPCGGCPAGEACNSDNVCVSNPCTMPCQTGQVCNPTNGECIQDPCLGVSCPDDQVCDFGSCFEPSHGDAGPPVDNQYVSAGGGGGCSTGGNTGAMGGLLVLLALIVPICFSRRREEEL